MRILFAFFLSSVLGLCCFGQLEEIKALLKEKPETEETATWLCDTAFTFYANNPAMTQAVAELALEKATEWNAELAMAKANHVIGVSYWARDIYDLAIEHYLEALDYYEKLDIQRGVATINLNIGTIYDDLGQSERGKKYLLESVRMVRNLKDSINLAKALNNLAVLYGNLNQTDSSNILFAECMRVRIALNDSIGAARVLNNIADNKLFHNQNVDFLEDDYKSAYSDLITSLTFIKEGQDNNLLATIISNIGIALIKLERYDESFNYLIRAEEIAKEIDSKIRLQQIYSYYSELYTKLNDNKNALKYFKLASELDQEQRSKEIATKIDLLNIQYETAKKEQQLTLLEKKNIEERSIRNMVVVISSSIVIIISLLLLSIGLKRKNDRQVTELKLQQLNEEIDKKNKEITSFTLNFIQKNQLMDDLKEQINEIKKQSDASVGKQLTRINRLVDETFRADEEWKTFQLTFDQMHDGFFTMLKETYPDLGNAELKLCALLRLNMNVKESARILGISPDSVKTARYRLRKKFSLKTEDNLIDFLIRIEKDFALQSQAN